MAAITAAIALAVPTPVSTGAAQSCPVPHGWTAWHKGEPYPNRGDVNTLRLASGGRRYWNGTELGSAGQAAYIFSVMADVRNANLILDPGDADCAFVHENAMLAERYKLCNVGACLFGSHPTPMAPAPVPLTPRRSN